MQGCEGDAHPPRTVSLNPIFLSKVHRGEAKGVAKGVAEREIVFGLEMEDEDIRGSADLWHMITREHWRRVIGTTCE